MVYINTPFFSTIFIKFSLERERERDRMCTHKCLPLGAHILKCFYDVWDLLSSNPEGRGTRKRKWEAGHHRYNKIVHIFEAL